MTSHDVVARLRKVLGLRRIGHAGTLDPLATGVLVVCVGRATRLSGYLTGQSKRYRARVTLGVDTDTLDADGKVVSTSEEVPASAGEIEAVLDGFRGRIRQTPPMFSARKVGGRRLHAMARQGEVVDREAREVDVHRLEMIAYAPPDLDLDVTCSKGTYVRVLAADIGSRLGCGGSIAALRRTESGRLTESDCAPLDAITLENAASLAADPNRALSYLPEVALSSDDAERFIHGNRVAADVPGDPARVTGPDGSLLGLGKMDGTTGMLQPACVLTDVGTPA